MQIYFKHHLMPRDPFGDALHLALAPFHKSDYLLTWNCQNLANANKVTHIRRINTLLGLHVPNINNSTRTYGGSIVSEKDSPIADIRRLRHSISEEFGHNPKLYIEYLQTMHGEYLKQTRLYEELPNKSLQPTGQSAARFARSTLDGG